MSASHRLPATWLAFAAAALLTVLAGALAARRLGEAHRASEWVQHTHAVLSALEETRGAVAAAEATRLALHELTDTSAEWTGHHAARAGRALRASRHLTRDHTLQQSRLDTLDRLVAEHVAELASAMTLVRAGQRDSAAALARSARGGRRADQIAALIGRMTTTEHELLQQRIATQRAHAASARVYIGLTLTASMLLVAVGVWSLRRQILRARELATTADRAAATAEAAVQNALRAEGHARASEARFRTALDALHGGFFVGRVAPRDGRAVVEAVEVNEAGARLLGLTRDAVLGADIGAHLRGDLAERLGRVCEQVLRSGERHVGEADLEVGGETRWLRVEIVALPDEVAISCHDVTDAKRAEAHLADAAIRDELTGLLNRRGFRARAGTLLAEARQQGRTDAVLALDLTGFKHVNDTYGHAEGDAALRAVAALLRETFRAQDVVARIGGDEFLVYLPGAPDGDGELVRRMRRALDLANVAAAARPYRIETGVGAASLEAGDDLDALVARADASLYADKARGAAPRRVSTAA